MYMPEQNIANNPGDKLKKYDRQLRLWGEHGQEALENAKVCLVNATATGTEILKNLILPGIGSFTIVDGNKVSAEDVGNNFFLDKDSIGKSRAQVATDLLSEMNDDVTGHYLEDTVENLLDNNCIFYSNFSIVIVTDLCERTLLRLAELLYDYEIPLLVCRSYGFVGYMRLVVKEHTVIESHPDNALEDLRLDQAFPGLKAFCENIDLESMTLKAHSHTPWLVLIYKYLQQWQEKHSGEMPKNYREKKEFKELLSSGIRRKENQVPEDEENFDEAIKNVNTALIKSKVPSEVEHLFNDKNCCDVGPDSPVFWLLVRALKDFVADEGKGLLPLRGSIPDMTADSERYIELQNVYKNQAAGHVTAVTNHLNHLTSRLGMDEPLRKKKISSPSASPAKPQDVITDSDIKLFCKNASFLRVVRNRSLAEEYKFPHPKAQDIGLALEDTDYNETVLYVMLRAVDKFYTEFRRYPGIESTIEADIPKLKSCLGNLLQDFGVTQTVRDEYVHEFCRYGASELHSIAAYMGGAAAQEVVKVLTRQFVPINNTYIYNGVKQYSNTVLL